MFNRFSRVSRNLILAAGDPYADYLVYASFDDDDGVVIESYTPEKDEEGGGFSVIAGAAAEFKISSNKLLINLSSGGDGSMAIIDAGKANVIIECLMTLGGNNPMLRFRVDGDNASPVDNCWVANPSCSANALRIQKVDGGSWSTEDTTAQTYTAGDVIELKITLNGDSITLEDLTNSKTASTTDSFQQTETEHGIGEGVGNNACYFDLFTIRSN
jgi:hypothetical protein